MDIVLQIVLQRTGCRPQGIGSRNFERRANLVARLVLCLYELVTPKWRRSARQKRLISGIYIGMCKSARSTEKQIKSECHRWRKYAIEGGPRPTSIMFPSFMNLSRRNAFQVSQLARALPTPHKRDCEEALRDYLATACNSYGGYFSPLDRVADETIKNKVKRCDRDGDLKVPTSSACLGFTRAQHGAAAALSLHVEPDTFSLAGKPFTRLNSARLSTKISRAKESLAKAKAFDMRLQPLVVSERGLKTRVVTRSDPALIAHGHSQRHRLWKMVLRIPQISRYLGKLPSSIRVAKVGSIISTDLTKATDGFSHRALSWFCLKFNIEPYLLFDGFTIDHEGERFDYLRGCPMGTPLSWSVLSLFHYMIFRELGLDLFAICGDDAISRMSDSDFSEYGYLLEHFGLSINKSKTFKSSDSGVFCEVYYKSSFKQPDILSRVWTVPMRGFAPVDADWTSNLQATFMECSRHISLKRLNRATKIAFETAYRLCARYKVNPYLPLWAGGIGMPVPRREMTLTRDEAAVVRWVSTHGTSFPVPKSTTGTNLAQFSRALSQVKWSVSTTDPCEHYDDVIAEMLLGPTILDVADGSLTERKFKCATIVRSMGRRFKLSPRAPVPLETRLTYLSLYNTELKPSAASVRIALGHDCATYDHLHASMFDPKYQKIQKRPE